LPIALAQRCGAALDFAECGVCGDRYDLVRSKIVEVEVYFGWTIPHEAPGGGLIDQK